MPIRTAVRLDRVQPSITLAISAKAKQLKAEGHDVIGFAAGEPDFDTPNHIKAAARRGLDEGVAKYTHVQGLVPLRNAIAAEMKPVHGVDYPIEQIIVSTGAKQALFNLFQALLDDGDEVIIPAPYWVSYPAMVKLAGGNPVIVETTSETGFAPTGAAIAAAVTDKTRAVVINTPCNPSGAVYPKQCLEEIAQVCMDKDLVLVTDDIYRSLVYDDVQYTSILKLRGELRDRTVVIDGVSKTYAMTGWRIGWTCAPIEIIKAMAKIQGQSTSGASHIAQVAALEAIAGPQECVEKMRLAFDARRKRMVELLNAIDGVSCRTPKGAFYAFPDVSGVIGKSRPDGGVIDSDVALANYLLDAAKVAVVPGTGFGTPGHVRMAYATGMEDIERGIARMSDAIGALK